MSETAAVAVSDEKSASALEYNSEAPVETKVETKAEPEVKVEPEPEAKTEEVKAEESEPEAEKEPEETERKRKAREGYELRREARRLKAENEVLRGQRAAEAAPDAELDRLVAEKVAQREFNMQCNKIYHDAVEKYGKPAFDESVKTMNEILGQAANTVIEAAIEAGDAPALLHYLGENPEEMERIANMTPHRVGVAIAKIATKLSTKPAKPVSKVPPPIRPVVGQAKSEPNLETMPIHEAMKIMDAQTRERRMG